MKQQLTENIKAKRTNLAESYNRLFSNTKRQLLEYARDSENGKKLDAYFDELVPAQGNAGTVNGEIVRAANRIAYRWYNDGDVFFNGYGTETAGPAMAFLMQHDEIDDQSRSRFKRAAEAVQNLQWNAGRLNQGDDTKYEKFLEAIFAIAVAHVEMIPTRKSNADLHKYDSLWQEEDEYDGYDEDEDEDYDEFDNEEQY